MTAPHLPAPPSLANALKPLLLAAGLLVSAGCDRNESPLPTRPGPLDGMPAASSPLGLMDAFLWCNQNLSIAGYRLLFTEDFQFSFAALDTMGNPYRDQPWTRNDELAYFHNLVNGGAADQPPARGLVMSMTTWSLGDDPRPGEYDPLRRRMIVVNLELDLETADGAAVSVSGKATFYVVRGDIATIPADLQRNPDPGTWYIERWEDQTFAPALATGATGAGPAASQPTKNRTWGSLKALYRESAPPAAAIATRP